MQCRSITLTKNNYLCTSLTNDLNFRFGFWSLTCLSWPKNHNTDATWAQPYIGNTQHFHHLKENTGPKGNIFLTICVSMSMMYSPSSSICFRVLLAACFSRYTPNVSALGDDTLRNEKSWAESRASNGRHFPLLQSVPCSTRWNTRLRFSWLFSPSYEGPSVGYMANYR